MPSCFVKRKLNFDIIAQMYVIDGGPLQKATSHINMLRSAFAGRMIKVVENLVARPIGHSCKLSRSFHS